MLTSSRIRPAVRSFIIVACCFAAFARAHAQTTPPATPSPSPAATAAYEIAPLPKFVVSAARSSQNPKLTPSSVTALDPADLRAAQVYTLKEALNRTPGLSVVSTGARGAQTTIFARGAESDHVLFFVDGVRMNSAQATYGEFLGGADLAGLDRIEILRGPQSTLYGSSALGGVVLLETAGAGTGPTHGLLEAHAGSFDTFGGLAAARGQSGPVNYSASLAYSETDNDRPDNGFKSLAYSTRVETSPTRQLLLGTTVRGQLSTYDEVGSTSFPSKGHSERPNHLVTTYAQWSPAAPFTSRLTAGWHQNEYRWTDKTFGPSSNFYFRNTRQILDWQNTWDATPWARIVAGINAEQSAYTANGQRLDDNLRSAYVTTSLQPLDGLVLDGGLRADDYDLTARATTWRTGAAYRIEQTGTKFRATYGTGFKAPSIVNRFGSPPFYAQSPAIGPEKSKGWDAGIDQEILGDKLTASATYFQNRFSNQIVNLSNSAYVFSAPNTPTNRPFIARNVKRSRSEGVELALTARPLPPLTLRAADTYTSALDLSAAKAVRLPRRPRHIGDLDARYQISTAWLLGAGVHFAADRVLNNTVRIEDYTTTRLYTSYAIDDAVSVKFRIENALDESHAEVAGYSSLPRAIFVGVERKF